MSGKTVACTCRRPQQYCIWLKRLLSQPTHPRCQDDRVTGKWNGSHGLNSAWQERSVHSATGDQYHQTRYLLGHNGWMFNAWDSNHKIVDFSPTEVSWLPRVGSTKTIPTYSWATVDDNCASFQSDADKYMVTEMRYLELHVCTQVPGELRR